MAAVDRALAPDEIRERLCELLTSEREALTDAWLARGAFATDTAGREAAARHRAQAERLLSLVTEGLSRNLPPGSLTPAKEAALQRHFPLVSGGEQLLALSEVIAEHLDAGAHPSLTPAAVLALMSQSLASLPAAQAPVALFAERLEPLCRASRALCILRDQDAIIEATLREAPQLVEAESGAIWLWDADLQAPILMATPNGGATAPAALPPSLLGLLRQASESRCPFSVDAGESEPSWPAAMRERAVAFVPLPAQDGCPHILTVHHAPERQFSHEDILMLSSLANLAASALHTARQYESDRRLMNLLQSSIRQVVQAASGRPDQQEEFVRSLLQVVEGLARADVVCAALDVDGRTRAPTVCVTGSLAEGRQDAVMRLAALLQGRLAEGALPATGRLAEVLEPAADEEWPAPYYAATPVTLGGKDVGVLYALSTSAFDDDRTALLLTIAERIGIGIDNMVRAANNQRLLVELAKINYVSETISSTFDPVRILGSVSHAASQALNAPVAFCAWLEADGTLRVLSGTAIGLPADVESELQLTDHHPVIRAVLEKREDVASRALGERGPTAFPVLERLQVADWVCVPMMVQDRARGVMLVADVRARVFERQEIAILSTYANQAALAMENSLLYEQTEQQLQQMGQLYEFLRTVTATLDLDLVLQQLVAAGARAIGTPVAMVCLAEAGSRVQRVAATTGIMRKNLAGTEYKPGAGIIGMAAELGTALISTHLRRDGRDTVLRDLAQVEELASSLTVPVLAQGEALGTLTVISRTPQEFTAAHVQLLQAMATGAGMAVQNARLYARERTRTAQLSRVLQEVSAQRSKTIAFVSQVQQTSLAASPLEEHTARMQGMLGALGAAQASMTEDNPTVVDVHRAAAVLVGERMIRRPPAAPHIHVRVEGAHPGLPFQDAVAALILIEEWLEGVIARRPGGAAAPVVLAFQQVGREVLLQATRAAPEPGGKSSENRDIMALVVRFLRGRMTESEERGTHCLRVRFILSGDEGRQDS